MIFSKKDVRALLIPLAVEQMLTAALGIADTLMVSRVSDAALSGVSLVDTINTLVLYFFTAMAMGGTVVCAQYIGRGERDSANSASRHLTLMLLVLSVVLAGIGAGLRGPVISLVYGSAEADVLEAANTYLFITALSYPFLAMFSGSAALYRSTGNSRLPMLVSGCSNAVNIGLNAWFIFALKMGVEGAALATLTARVLSCGVMLTFQRNAETIGIRGLFKTRPDKKMMRTILRIGVPTGLENSIFQLGKILVQSTISTLGTAAIAAQAVVYMLESLTSRPSLAVGTGLLTVCGQSMGAGDSAQAKKYVRRFMVIAELLLIAMMLVMLLLMGPILRFTRLTPESARLTRSLVPVIFAIKTVPWVFGFVLPNGIRAAGDVKFPLIIGLLSMWGFRVVLCRVLCAHGFGLWGVWIGMMTDWTFRGAMYLIRYKRGKWTKMKVLDG